MATTHQCRYWRRAAAKPRPGGSGLTFVTSGHVAAPGPRQHCSSTRRIGRASTRGLTSSPLPVYCTPTDTPASMDCSRPGGASRRGGGALSRRKFFDVHAATASPIAKEALERISQLYAVEQTINGSSPDQRRQRRQLRSKPIAEALAVWAEQTVPKLSRKSELAAAFRYMRARWTALTRCFEDGRLGLDNNPAERALRGVAIGRKNYLFAVPMRAVGAPPPCTR